MNIPARLLSAAIVSGLTACIPYMDWKEVPVDQSVQTDKDLIIVPGDRVRVHASNMNVYIFKVTRTDRSGFYGIARDDKEYRMQYADINELEVLRGDVAVFPPPAIVGPINMGGGGIKL